MAKVEVTKELKYKDILIYIQGNTYIAVTKLSKVHEKILLMIFYILCLI
jgi:hypothetical protein